MHIAFSIGIAACLFGLYLMVLAMTLTFGKSAWRKIRSRTYNDQGPDWDDVFSGLAEVGLLILVQSGTLMVIFLVWGLFTNALER